MIRRWLRSAGKAAGAHAIARHATRDQLRILMYHRFAGRTSNLEAQCRHIRRHYSPVRMDQVAGWLAGEAPLPERALAVTVDDGYRDFLEAAWPVFSRYEIPVMVYIISDFAAGDCWLWWDLLTELLVRTADRKVQLPAYNGRGESLAPSTPAERRRMAEQLSYKLMRIPDAARRSFVDALPEATGINLPKSPPAAYAAMSWTEISALAKAGADFGAHTRTHPILSRLNSEEAQRDEMSASRDALAAAIGVPVWQFCFPVGGPDEFDHRSIAAAKACGFATATTTIRGLNPREQDPLRLSRLGVDPDQDLLYFSEMLAGVRRI
jgi:peptidoglycan/xylan/chitin deacetylase (PgdA/CDA1 family)